MMEDPDFTPGSLRAVVEEFQAQAAQLARNLTYHAKTMDEVNLLRGQLLGTERCIGVVLKNTDDEIKKRLGIRP